LKIKGVSTKNYFRAVAYSNLILYIEILNAPVLGGSPLRGALNAIVNICPRVIFVDEALGLLGRFAQLLGLHVLLRDQVALELLDQALAGEVRLRLPGVVLGTEALPSDAVQSTLCVVHKVNNALDNPFLFRIRWASSRLLCGSGRATTSAGSCFLAGFRGLAGLRLGVLLKSGAKIS